MEKVALVVSSSGEIYETGVSLAELQAGVDGLIQPIDVTDDLTMWVNEEYLFRPDFEMNLVATAIYEELGADYAIGGPVVFTGGSDENGNTLGLSPEGLEIITKLAETAREFSKA